MQDLPHWSGESQHKFSLGREQIQSRCEEKDLGVMAEKLNVTQECELADQKNSMCPGLHQEKCDQQV